MNFRWPVKTALLLTVVIFIAAYGITTCTGMMDSFMGFFHHYAAIAANYHWFLADLVRSFPYTIWIVGTLNVFALLYALMNHDYSCRRLDRI